MAAEEKSEIAAFRNDSALSGQGVVFIRKAAAADIREVVLVHEEAFAGFFMTRLGPGFLHKYYVAVLNYCGSVFYVALRERRIVGFVAGFVDPAGFYRSLRSRRLRLALAVALRMFSSPGLLVRVFATSRLASARSSRHDDSEAAELASIGVMPGAAGNGIGRRLVRAFCEEAFSRKAARVLLTTDAENNSAVNSFYLSLGFKRNEDFIQHSKRRMTQYTFSSHDWTKAEFASGHK